MTQYVVLPIINMESVKSDVNGPKKKYAFGVSKFFLEWQKHQKKEVINV